MGGDRKTAIYGLIFTLSFAIFFTGLQYFEYLEAPFTIADSVYGSAFFCSTGLHGLITKVPTKLKNKIIFQSSIYKLNFITNLFSTLPVTCEAPWVDYSP
jgi:hypothetical protein